MKEALIIISPLCDFCFSRYSILAIAAQSRFIYTLQLCLENLSTQSAITPSPVTLHAVPKLSCAKYKAIIKATAPSLKPSMLVNNPSADITAPPGAPGAAIITTPSIKINGNISDNDGTTMSGESNITAIAQVTMVIVDPDKWIVAQSGTVKLATSSLTLLDLLARRETGIVAALDIVPIAVKYAGSIFLINSSGFLPSNRPAHHKQGA